MISNLEELEYLQREVLTKGEALHRVLQTIESITDRCDTDHIESKQVIEMAESFENQIQDMHQTLGMEITTVKRARRQERIDMMVKSFESLRDELVEDEGCRPEDAHEQLLDHLKP